jgi:FkbM family methyltransferase
MNNTSINKNLIFDIGMHNGRDSQFYLDKGFKVIAIEASPISCQDAESKFERELASGQLKIYNNAISDQSGTVKFIRYKNHDDWSSIVPEWNMSMYSDETEVFDVETSNVDKVISEEGVPYYMKIDIEGSDILCLNALKNVPVLPKFISLELLSVNNMKESESSDYLAILCTLKSLGYTKFQLIDQSKHEHVVCPNPALEGSYTDTKFDGFSSGLFGKELPNNWKNIDEVIFDYLIYVGKKPNIEVINEVVDFRSKIAHIFFKPKSRVLPVLDVNGWFDVHATY